jgi:hypothetical protein
MLTLIFVYRRAPWPVRLLALAVLSIVFVSSIVRSHKAIHQIQERQQHVHPCSSTR